MWRQREEREVFRRFPRVVGGGAALPAYLLVGLAAEGLAVEKLLKYPASTEAVAKPYEAAKLDVGRRGRSVASGSHFARVHGHARRRDAVAQEAELLMAEGALGCPRAELLLPQDG